MLAGFDRNERSATMAEVAVVAISVAKPGNEARLQRALLALIEPTRREPGVLQYELHQDLADARRFVVVERWESEEALAAHARSEHIAAWRADSIELVEHSEIRVVRKIA
jgi:quinol monooxygenase YgiN